jgi:hypothetical protein
MGDGSQTGKVAVNIRMNSSGQPTVGGPPCEVLSMELRPKILNKPACSGKSYMLFAILTAVTMEPYIYVPSFRRNMLSPIIMAMIIIYPDNKDRCFL